MGFGTHLGFSFCVQLCLLIIYNYELRNHNVTSSKVPLLCLIGVRPACARRNTRVEFGLIALLLFLHQTPVQKIWPLTAQLACVTWTELTRAQKRRRVTAARQHWESPTSQPLKRCFCGRREPKSRGCPSDGRGRINGDCSICNTAPASRQSPGCH